jgi:hypothetical protein
MRTFKGMADALTKYAESEGYGPNEPITYGDLQHVADQLNNGRNADGSEKAAAKPAKSKTK